MNVARKPMISITAGLLAVTPLVVALGPGGLVLGWTLLLVVLGVGVALWVEPLVHPRDLAPVLVHRPRRTPESAAAQQDADPGASAAA